ncbi:hypothetical protein HanXRQr2_Chr10g0451631 [Helianthus annuus]|uniref:Uncharacterized protein n=1 Tax=Helianthus annuus TaxID=4232 RepID=A0A9K3N5B0_HELAN|nr:hypothetical protein HanXRQr2_Chr10g0451631 [Helianthus annuus]
MINNKVPIFLIFSTNPYLQTVTSHPIAPNTLYSPHTQEKFPSKPPATAPTEAGAPQTPSKASSPSNSKQHNDTCHHQKYVLNKLHHFQATSWLHQDALLNKHSIEPQSPIGHVR